MAVTKKGKFIVVFAVVVPIILIVLLIINWFVYPFVSAKPNFADVEAVYNKMVVPADWVKKGEGANKGIAGRQCPIESDGCFSKSASFEVPMSDYKQAIEQITTSMGCTSSGYDRNEQVGGPSATNFRCSSGAIIVSGTVIERLDKWEGYVNASSR